MPSGLTFKLYVSGMSPGLTFELLDIRPVAPNDGYGWKGAFRRDADGKSLSVSCEGQQIRKNWPLPQQFPKAEVFLGEAHFEGHNGLWSSGEGAKVTLDFRLYGTTSIEGNSISVDEAGVIVVSTTNWKGFARPDFVNTTYSWRRGTTDPVNVPLSVPSNMAGMPPDLLCIFGIGTEEERVGMATTTHREAVDAAMGYVLQGILWTNEALFKWALGLFLPF